METFSQLRFPLPRAKGAPQVSWEAGTQSPKGKNENLFETDLFNLDQTSGSLIPGGLLSVYLSTM